MGDRNRLYFKVKMALTYLVVVLSFILIENVFAQCPAGWSNRQSSCYHVSRDADSWVESMRMCQSHKGRLVSIETSEEQQYLESLLSSGADDKYWVGGSDWTVEGVWIWEPSGTNITYTNWEMNQPDNDNGVEHCMYMNRDSNFMWVDEFCQDTYNYICERPAEPTQPIIG